MATKTKTADEGFLTTAAQTIGSTLGQLVKKAGDVAASMPKKAAVKKAVKAVKKKAVAVKKKTVAVEKKAVAAVKKKVATKKK
jgi:hypothetical protein